MVYSINDPTVNLVFFQNDILLISRPSGGEDDDDDDDDDDGGGGISDEQMMASINSTHQIVTHTFSVHGMPSVYTDYRCFPQFSSNNSFLLPSQALAIDTTIGSSGLPNCYSNDIFSTYTTRCADIDSPQISECNSNSIVSKYSAIVPTTTLAIGTTTATSSSTSTIGTTSTAVMNIVTTTTVTASSSSECVCQSVVIQSTGNSSTIGSTAAITDAPLLYSAILPMFTVLLVVIAAQSVAILGLCCKYICKRVHNPEVNMCTSDDPLQLNMAYFDPIGTSLNVNPPTYRYSDGTQTYDEIDVGTQGPPKCLPPGYTHLMKTQLERPHQYDNAATL